MHTISTDWLPGFDLLLALLSAMGVVSMLGFAGLCLGLMLKAGWRGALLGLAFLPLLALLPRFLVPISAAGGGINPVFVLAQAGGTLVAGLPLLMLLILPWKRG